MAESQTKIAQELTPEQLHEMLERLYKEKGDWKRTQEIAAEFGVTVGRSAVFEFRKKEFEPWLQRIERQKNMARYIAEHSDPAAGGTIADAAAASLSQDVFEFLQESGLDLNLYDDEGLEKANTISKVIQRLRSGDHRMKALQMKLTEFEDQRRALQKTLQKARQPGGWSDEVIDEFERHLGWKKPQPTAETAPGQ